MLVAATLSSLCWHRRSMTAQVWFCNNTPTLLSVSSCLTCPAGYDHSMKPMCIQRSVSCTTSASTGKHMALRLERTDRERGMVDMKVMNFEPLRS